MKKIALFIPLLFLHHCGPQPDTVDKIKEDGVEVVLNHLEPYRIPGEPDSFTPEEIFSLDFERDDLAELGIGAIQGFDADPRGHIYLLSEQKIFKFDDRGIFLFKFGKTGQGPGEYASPGKGRFLESGELAFYDRGNDKFLFYAPDGEYRREIKNRARIQGFGEADYLDGGGYLFEILDLDPEKDKLTYHLAVFDSDFQKVTDLRERAHKENPYRSNRYNLFDAYIKCRIHRNKIYVINQADPEFVINLYDFQGNNIRRIRTEYNQVPISEEFKRKARDSYKGSSIAELIKTKGYFPDHFPPVKEFHVDDEGRILCESYEKSDDLDMGILYIFSPEGVFIGRQPIESSGGRRFRNNRLYSLIEKESGYQRLVVYDMTWKTTG